MDERNHNLDDLINSGGGQPIIVQEGGSDKKFLYTLLILLVVLFIIAMAVIAYLGSRYFSNNNTQNKAIAKQAINTPQTIQNDEVTKKAIEVAKKQNITKIKEEKVGNNTLSELESLVKEQEEKNVAKSTQAKENANDKVASNSSSQTKQTIASVAQSAAGGKTLSQEDLEKIAKLVAQELAKNKAINIQKNTTLTTSSKKANRDQELVASLQSAQTDTLENEAIDTTSLQANSKINATSGKKVDTFNKVIIKNQKGDDELAKLASEIDTILQSEEVTKTEKNLKYGKVLKEQIKERAQELRFIVVKKGDTLSSIAYKAYGRASAYVKIYEANPDLIKNPNKIYVGMKLRVPVDEEYLKRQQGR